MIRLENIDLEKFKNIVYPEYIKLFPEQERKSYKTLENSYKKGILKIIQVVDENIFVGFILINSIKENKYLLVDYFAILPKYQDKGYGSKAIQILKDNSKEYYGIFIEVDKEGLGTDEEENRLRKRRVEFYEKLGFYKLNFDLNLFDNIFTPYVLQISNKKEDEDKIIKDVFDIYLAIMGKEKVKKYCRIVEEKRNEIFVDNL